MRVLVVAVAVILFAGMFPDPASAGRTQPVRNVTGAMISAGSGAELNLSEIEGAIRAAATARGWTVKKVADGQLVAELFVRTHYAKIDIAYDLESYSITYRDSSELMYEDGEIHRNYNNWIIKLTRQINAEFAHM